MENRPVPLLLLLASFAAFAQTEAPYDLVIANGRVVDGTGAAGRVADVAIRDGRIVRVGALGSTPANRRIDATGLVVAPGFIDVHTHADDLADHPRAENFVRMGVTTVVGGNCGSSALQIGDALERIRATGASVNFATLIGHNTIRSAVMGTAERDPSIAELDRMKGLVFKGLVDGAVGFSTGLQYVPGTYARNNEIVELARVAANNGGLYATHMRNEGTALLEAIAESIRVAETLDMPLEISHLKVDSPKQWGASAAALAMIDDARKRGVNVQADQYAYTAGSSSLSIRFPAWALEGGAARVQERLTNSGDWARIKKEMQELVEARGFADLSWAVVAKYRRDPSLNGLSMKAIASKLKGSESADAQFEAARELMLGGGASMVYHFISDDDLARIMRHPMVAVASDSGLLEAGESVPHPRGYGNNARVLGDYVRDRRTIGLEEAVRKMTSLPARFFGFANRGVIREGAIADVVVFDAGRVQDVATYDKPHAFPEGIVDVIVSGQPVVRDGGHTGARPGQVVKRVPPTGRPGGQPANYIGLTNIVETTILGGR